MENVYHLLSVTGLTDTYVPLPQALSRPSYLILIFHPIEVVSRYREITTMKWVKITHII